MFLIDATFEDCRIHAESETGSHYKVRIKDNMTGKQSPVEVLTALQLQCIMAFNLDMNGMPEGYEKMYVSLEPIYKDYPIELRPIP